MTKENQNICIIGNGAMATVLALLLESRGHRVIMWGPIESDIDEMIQTRQNTRYLPGYPLAPGIRLTCDAAEAMAGADLVVNAIPTQFIREVFTRLAGSMGQAVPIVSVAKGLETDTRLRPTQIIEDVLTAHGGPWAATPGSLACLSGPTIAGELARCLPATVVVASADQDLTLNLQQVFTTHWFRVYTLDDPLGVELAGAMKNVIALAAGMIDGLGAGVNAKSALLARGLAEIARLGVAMGARAETFFGVAGVGDLATTCFSPEGRNRTCGEKLGQGIPLKEALAQISGVVEGVATARAVVAMAKEHQVEMPIMQAVAQVLFEGMDPLQGISQLMGREPKAEMIG